LFGAIDQLETVLKDKGIDDYAAARAEARLEELKKEARQTSEIR